MLLFVCRCYLSCVAWFSDWFDNLGFLSEVNTYRHCAASSLPLWGNTDVVLADSSFSGAIVRERSKGISGAVAWEDLQHNQVPNQKSHLLAVYIICHLPLPHFTKICHFIRLSLSFAVFLPDMFLSAILLCGHHDSREHQVM